MGALITIAALLTVGLALWNLMNEPAVHDPLVNKRLGKRLKAVADPSGSVHQIRVRTIHDLADILHYFFSRKHHEWIAVCLLFEGWETRVIWINKGPDRETVWSLISPEQAVAQAKKSGAQAVVVAHNHPGGFTAFSDADRAHDAEWRQVCHRAELHFGSMVFVGQRAIRDLDRPLERHYLRAQRAARRSPR